MLALTGVTKTYGDGVGRVTALDDVSLHVEAGGFVAVCGPSGSGKSTLLNIIGLLDKPDAGDVSLGGERVVLAGRAEAARLRNRLIGFVFQSFQLLPRLTAWENVALPLFHRGVGRIERRAKALAALDKVGLSDRAAHRPEALSGGQRQRVALARALVGEPALVLADEPTGSLDSVSAGAALDLLRDVNERLGVTIVMVTHDREAAARCDRTINIRDGRVAGEAA